MNDILLTIAIPTIQQRKDIFNELLLELKRQSEPYGDEIEIIWLSDNKEITIGAKRQKLNDMAKGKYVVQWDDDDWIHQQGIDMIMSHIRSDIDVISYNYSCDIGINNGTNYNRDVSIEHNNKLIDDVFYVTPDCKNPIKKEIIDKVKFRDSSWSEEFYFKIEIQSLLKTEHKINENIYIILNRSNEEYDYDKRYNLITNKLI